SIPQNFVHARNEYEMIFSNIWKDVLGHSQFGIYENFFDIGGNSLLVAAVYGRIPENIKKKISMTSLFKYPTIEQLASSITKNEETFREDYLVSNERIHSNQKDIAIIGIALRVPGA